MDATTENLLAGDEVPAVETRQRSQDSPFLFVCDHASRAIPRKLGDLGLPEAELERHIAWDIGALGVAERLLDSFAGTLISQNYSRLVIDCNRPPHVPSAIPTISENTVIPGNGGISPAERSQRCKEIFDPYHREISSYLDNREAKGLETVLISIHSFTPVFKSVPRPWDIGLLYNRDDRLAGPIHEALQAMGDLVVGDNEPYAVSDETDYTIPVHGEGRGIHHMMFEIRQDLIAEESGQDLWSQRLERVLTEACKAVLKGPQRNRTGPAF